ncbi:hypothetical protein ONS95_004486 [Cadophora gregata]|uniref:uncharacterized protein n=1 Tax=Cadophora gregata TaxID=51156 RepID=UPI0026DC8545|nr:uncharacterized protein ONS95_004486 [Cadophora gregata]KAK0105977.1 hypothetical protein ONS95_004486 [Cadophora gregata]
MSASSHNLSQMFRRRTNSQKPADGLYASFRQFFPEVSTITSSAAASSGQTPLGDGLTDSTSDQPRNRSQRLNDPDITPRASHEPWRYTPPLLNSNSFLFAPFTGQLPGCFEPIAEGTSTLHYNEDADLPIPGVEMGMGLGMPLVLPTSEDGVHIGWMTDRHCFPPQTAQPHEFYNFNLFDPHQTFAPYYLSDQPPDVEPLGTSGETSPIGDDPVQTEIHSDSPSMNISSRPYDTSMSPPLPASTNKFRFHVTLNAATAIINQADEIPMTYLNKGHVYSVSIVDTAPPMPGPIPVQYRTAIRISFEDGQQGHTAATHWKLWKDARGTKDVHQRGGKLQGVEYVEEPQVTEDHSIRTRANLETASLDGFSVLWTQGSGGSVDCHVAMRFNFLSTDFSHSKGVKGIPSRLYAKTEVISTNSLHYSPEVPETCFYKVKVFRDYGSQRKLWNNITCVKKTIDKLKQQIAQVETRSGKRKRDRPIDTKVTRSRLGNVLKRKRTWSISSASPTEEDLSLKLQTIQDMFASTRPVSVLYVRGQEQDDPNLHPIKLTGEPPDLVKVKQEESTA